MGRSKFPGKPSKLQNRKRISVLTGVIICDSDISITEDCNNQLSILKGTFRGQDVGNDEEINKNLSKPYQEGTTETSLGDNITDTLMQEDKSVLQTGALTRNQQKTDNINNPNSVEGKQTMHKKTVTFGSVLESFSDGSSAKKCSFNRDVPLVSIIKKSSFKVSKNDSIVKPSKLTEISAKYADNIKTINCAKLKLSVNECLKETSGAVGGFVLPVRSAHSSRVIKPNKRFIETEETKIPRSGKLNLKKPRLVLIPRDALATDEAYETCDSASPHSNEATDDSSDARIEWKTLRPNVDKSVFTSFNVGRQFVNKSETTTESSRHFSNLCFSEQSSSESQSESALSSDSESGSETDLEGQRPFSPRQNTGKVILRKATLQLQAQANVGTEGPFSITAVTNTATPATPGSPPGTVTCGVCGAVRFYKFVRQARKFGIYTCESCRKFISKMVKRQSVTPLSSDLNMLQCHKGEGTCHVPPIVRSHQWKLNYRCSYKARCPACWLKLCLRSFHIPGELRAQLLATLPANIRETVEKNMSNPDTDTTAAVASNNIFPSCLKKNIDKPSAESESPATTNKVFGVEINSNAVNRLQSWSQDVPSDGELVVTGLESSEKEIAATKPQDRKVLVTEIDHLAVKKRKRLHTKVRKKDKVNVAANNVEVSKRQKIELKGPRVKHVCRSASVVLGQPIATFPQDTETELETIEPETIEQKIPVPVSETKLVKEPEPTAVEVVKLCADSTELVASEPLTADILPDDKVSDVPITEINLEVSEVPATEITVVDCNINIGTDDNVLNNNNNVVTDDTKCAIAEQEGLPILDDTVLPVKNPVSINCLGPRKAAKAPIYVPAAPNYRTQQQVSKRSVPSAPLSGPLISIDFWENYDPVEVSRTGFGLIGSEPFTVQALCFLCGSRGDTNGSDPLVFCSCCCEPYHQYCVEDELINCVKSVTDASGDISAMDVSLGLNRSYNYQSAGRRLSWLCPRCTVCQSCGLTSGTKLSCQKCYKNYHSTCLGNNKRQLCSDRPFICSPCLKCKSCGTSRVTKYLGNMPMCSPCFKLRQKGNYCPLCQRCYEDNDYDTKMMECGDCKRWVHAHCEGLTNEKYQVLSTLPESVEYVCRKCSVDTNAPWREAVDLELRNGFLGVLRGMSKNRKACALLKWSPRKKTICGCQPIESVKRIQFVGDKESESAKRVSAGKDINNLREVMCMEKSDADSNSCLKDVIDSQDQNSSSVKELSDEQEMENAILSIEGDKLDSGNCSTDEELTVKMPSQDVESDSEFMFSKKESFVCYCQKQSWQAVPTLLDIKKKVTHDEYPSLQQFNSDMMEAIEAANCEELLTVYKKIVCDSFPWFTNRPHENVRREDDNPEEFADVDKDIVNSNTECKDQEVPSMVSADDFEDYFYEDNHHVEDTRSCLFCKGVGDGLPLHEARLLYCGQNEWVHANCALWSAEVFEEIDGSLQNVHSAVSRGRMIRCSSCAMKGASVGCCAKNCSETYHFSCARRIDCAFMDDKTVYCPTHSDEERPKKLRQLEKDFEIRRPVYVELDRKKKKFSEIGRVQFIVGSLLVKNIGKFIPVLSDHIDGIVPSDFLCTRLFWSTKEPWKIVQYTIKTTMQVFRPQPNCTLGNNLTVDHSLSPTEVQKQLSEVVCLHKSVENEESSPVNTSDNNMQIKSSDDNTVKHILDQIIDAACKNDTEDICDEETHNTDLLPPELEDAIFEDLPHDLLDGISMLDILPKLMSYEDLIAMDIKNEVCFGGDLLKEKDDFSETKSESECLNKCKKVSSDNAVADWIDTKTSDLIDDLLQTTTKVGGQELKRSKSEVFPSNLSQLKSIASGRSQQRSCSLTWSCKMDGSINVKRRKLARSSQSGQSGGMFLDMSDKNHMLQELRLPEGVLVTLGRPDTVKELKYRLEEDSVINSERRRSVSHQLEEGKENKCLLWQSRSQPRLLQVDGPGDSSSSGSEGGSPPRIPEDLKISQLDGADDMSSSGSESGSPEHQTEIECPLIQHKYAPSCNETILLNNDMPVKCNRCHCTYRTQDSYERHLETCEMITSESDSDTPRSPESDKDNPAVNTDAVLLVQNVTSNAYISEAQKQINQQNVCSISIPMQTSVQSQPTISIVPNFNIPGVVQQSHPLTYNNGLLQTSYQVSPFNQCNNGLQNVVIDSNQLQSHDHTQMQTLQLANLQQNHQQIIPQSVHPQNLPAHFQNTMVQCSTEGSHYQQPMIQNNVNVPNSINIQSCPQNQSRIITLSNPQISQQYQQSVFQSPQNVRSVSNSASYQAVPTVITIGNQQITTSPPKQQLILPQNMRSPPKRQVVACSGAPVVNARGRGRGNSRLNVTKRILKPDKPIIVNQNISVARPQTSNVVYQQPNNQNSIILQQMQNPNVISYVEAIQQQNGNVQYIATLAPSENEYKQPTQYLTPNPLIPGTFQLHTDTGNLFLTNGGLSMLPSGIQLAQSHPTVLGTLIQPPGQGLQCGMMAEQMLLGATPGLEMVTDSSGCVYLTSQPMYYGLETIVQNTVMSSQQFVSSAMQGVLSSNSSFSATTTQVFQASKIEPMCEVPTGYVVVNNLPSDNGVQASITLQPTSVQTPCQTTLTQNQTNNNSSNNNLPWRYTMHTPEQHNIVQISPPKVNIAPKQQMILSKMPSQLIHKVLPSSSQQMSENVLKTNQGRNAVRNLQFKSLNPQTFQMTQNNNSMTLQYSNSKPSLGHEKSTIHHMQNSCKPLTSASNQQSILLNHVDSINTQTNPGKHLEEILVNTIDRLSLPTPNVNVQMSPHQTPMSNNQHATSNVTLTASNMQNTCSIQLPTAPYAQPHQSGIPTNIVNPIQQVNVQNVNPTPARPMNRVLPMQTSIHRDSPIVPFPNPRVSPDIKLKPTPKDIVIESITTLRPKPKPKEVKNEPMQFKSSLPKGGKLENTSLKMIFQKQSPNGCYKISNKNMESHQPGKVLPAKSSFEPLNSLNLNMIQKQVLQGFPEQTAARKLSNSKHVGMENTLNCFKLGKKPKDNAPKMLYEVQSQDGFSYTSSSITELWKKVMDSVQNARRANNMPTLPEISANALTGIQLLGLHNNAMKYLVEQLPGANKCVKYKPKFHKLSAEDSEYETVFDLLKENAYGAGRCEPFMDRSEYDMFSWLASRHRQRPTATAQSDSEIAAIRRATSTNLPMAMRFRYLKETSKEAVGVFRSLIHGRGLFCRRDIEAGEMVIEYAGEVIRATLTDQREKYYDSKGIGCYMFRIDDHLVVDATMRGNAARFINHSCEPNCYSRVVDILGHKHIIIFALRRILQGEELTYDYKFPFEDVKIPCTCGSRKCRKYLN